jgi:hypothetical protein
MEEQEQADLDELGLKLEDLRPTIGDELFADEHPVLALKVRREPGIRSSELHQKRERKTCTKATPASAQRSASQPA